VAAALVAACATASTEDHMFEHFERAGEIQSALIRGDLEGARPAARRLAEDEGAEGLPSWSEPYRATFSEEAGTVAAAESLDDAVAGAARLYRSCGACHQAVPGGPRFTVGDEAPPDVDPVAHMGRHLWAVDRMWAGLVGPSEESWARGLAALQDDPLKAEDLPGGTAREEDVEEMAELLHREAYRATQASNWNDRTEAYGRILASCAGCHVERPFN
jgi:mono/diheme cytochrome c family protein